jgi:hypothetical protein
VPGMAVERDEPHPMGAARDVVRVVRQLTTTTPSGASPLQVRPDGTSSDVASYHAWAVSASPARAFGQHSGQARGGCPSWPVAHDEDEAWAYPPPLRHVPRDSAADGGRKA